MRRRHVSANTFYPVWKTHEEGCSGGSILWSEAGGCPGLLAPMAAAPSRLLLPLPLLRGSSSEKPPLVQLGHACGATSSVRFLLVCVCPGPDCGVLVVGVGFGGFPLAGV